MTDMPATPFSTEAFYQTGSELLSVLKQETELSTTRKRGDRAALLARKQELVEAWQAGMDTLAAQPDTLKLLPSEQQRAFRTLRDELDTALRENLKALENSHKATGRIIELVATAVRQSTATTGGYAANGQGINAYGTGARPMSVNTDLEL
ncbi:MAG: hypothetical protein Alpg2KO_14530 [Alphaproteobacteria bacterium]